MSKRQGDTWRIHIALCMYIQTNIVNGVRSFCFVETSGEEGGTVVFLPADCLY